MTTAHTMLPQGAKVRISGTKIQGTVSGEWRLGIGRVDEM